MVSISDLLIKIFVTAQLNSTVVGSDKVESTPPEKVLGHFQTTLEAKLTEAATFLQNVPDYQITVLTSQKSNGLYMNRK